MPDPCPHDCAIGVATIGTVTVPLTTTTMLVPAARTVWECTVCRAIGEDGPDGNTITWAQAGA